MILNQKTVISSLSGLQYGYNTSIIAAAILFLKTTFSLDPIQQGLVASIVLLGALSASLFTGTLANLIGRKWTMFLGALLFLIGVGLSTFTNTFTSLLVGRFIVGIAGGIAVTIPPIYLIETSPSEERGASANVNQIGIALGSLIAYFVGYLLAVSESWREMFAVGFVPGFIQLFGLFFIPESPYKNEPSSPEENNALKTVFSRAYRSRLLLGIMLCAFQSLIGAPAVFYFTPLLFEKAGMKSDSDALLVTVFIGLVYLLGILISFWTVDRWGRRALTLISTFGMAGSLLLISLCSNMKPEFLTSVMSPSLFAFVCCYAIGIGPIPPLVVGEITPAKLRGHVMALTGLVGLSMNYLVTLTCPPLLQSLGLSKTLALYAGLGAIGFLFFLKSLPETKGKNLAEITKLFP